MKKIFLVLISMIAVSFFLSCEKDDLVLQREEAVAENYKKDKVIKIAVVNDWKNQAAQIEEKALKLAEQEINEAGGIQGAKLELVWFDDNANLNDGLKTAYQVCSDNEICAVIGHSFSNISLRTSLIYHYYGVLMMNHISTDKKITNQGCNLIFRNIPDDEAFGYIAADFCSRKNWDRIAIICEDSVYGENLANEFEFRAGHRSLNVVTRDNYDIGFYDAELKNTLRKWKNNYTFDAIFIAGNNPELTRVVQMLRSEGFNQPIVGSESFDDGEFEKYFDSEENGRVFSISNFDLKSQRPAFKAFKDKFNSVYGIDPTQEATQGYDALKVLVEAMNYEASLDSKLQKSGKFCTPLRIADGLHAIHWDGPAGPYEFDETNDVKNPHLVVKEFMDQEFVLYDKEE